MKMLVLVLFQSMLPYLSQSWQFPSVIVGLRESCVEIPCTYSPAGNPEPSGVVWYLHHYSKFPEIYRSQNNSSVEKDYKNRTSLIPGINSCTLRIDPVSVKDHGDYYYPGIEGQQSNNAHSKDNMLVQLQVRESPIPPELSGSSLMAEGTVSTFTCSAWHTCGSSPPSLHFNKPGETQRHSEDLSDGIWKEILILRYNASHRDDGTELTCAAAYHNGVTSHRKTTLDIRYRPHDVAVVVSSNREVKVGNDVILRCSSRAKPPVSRYEWFRGKERLKLRLGSKHIQVLNVTRETKPYSCAAINAMGRGESPVTEIPLPFAATGVEVVYLPPAEGAAELKCSFTRSRPNVTHYTWLKDGKILVNKTTDILALDGKKDHSGSYSCIAHNMAGNSTSTELIIPGRHDDEEDNLMMILGVVAGAILLIILLLLLYIFIGRRKNKSTHESTPTHGETHAGSPLSGVLGEDEILVRELEYEKIQPHPRNLSRSVQPQSSVRNEDANDDDDAIYSNKELIEEEAEIEYLAISHTPRQGPRQDKVYQEEVEYATIKR